MAFSVATSVFSVATNVANVDILAIEKEGDRCV